MNTGDSRALGLIQGGGVRKTRNRRHRRRANKINKSKGKHKNKNAGGANSKSRTRTRRHKKTPSSNVNYAGRQIGHQSQRQRQRQSQRQSQRQRSQSGGFRSDANLIVSSLGNLLDSGFSTLKGTEVGASPIPFSDTLYERNL